jgi:GH24 family phage-related lysozyme (muramidase)
MTTLKDIQRRVGVTPDGVWGPQTAAAIAEALGMMRPLAPSPACAALVKQFEGCELSAYPDPGSGGDPWTIGYGATGPGIAKGVTWTQAQCDQRLADDLERFAVGVNSALNGAPTTQNEFDAMVSLAFNIGLENFRRSTLLRMHQDGDKAGAAEQFARWNKASGKVLNGLTRRRAAEAALYRDEA